MPDLSTVFGTPTSVTITTQALAAGAFSSSAIVATSGAHDLIVGGAVSIASDTVAAGNTINIFVTAQYSATSTDMGGGIGALLLPNDGTLVDETDFMKSNLRLLFPVKLDLGAVANTYHWGPVSVKQSYGGVLPSDVMFIVENNSAAVMGIIEIDYKTVTPRST